MERLAQRCGVVDSERLCASRVSKAGNLFRHLCVHPKVGRIGCRRPRNPPLHGPAKYDSAGGLHEAWHEWRTLSGVRVDEVKVGYDRIYEVIGRIPRGRVATYGQIAEVAGIPGQPRRIGYALSALPPDNGV